MHRDPNYRQLAEETLALCRTVAGFTEMPGSITRTFLSDPMRECHRTLSRLMYEVGMRVETDAIGNLRGVIGTGERPRLLIGSHIDTVPCAGAFDGVLGVGIALAITSALNDVPLPFDIEIIAFSEEEGIRFGHPFLGSMAAAGRFHPQLLDLRDANGCSMREAIQAFGLDPGRIPEAQVSDRAFAYLEFHIEQGPVLDQAGESLAAVTAIAGQSRGEMVFKGQANHAGTTPMELRRDALTGAAEWIASVEQLARHPDRLGDGLVATVGRLQVSPGASNVIPGEVRASLDVRHADDNARKSAVREMCGDAEQIASRRGLRVNFEEQLNQDAVPMDEHLVTVVQQAMSQVGESPRNMVSGAGHDAMIMAAKVPSAMVFLRSIGGISHHPDEDVHLEDVEKAIRLGAAMLRNVL